MNKTLLIAATTLALGFSATAQNLTRNVIRLSNGSVPSSEQTVPASRAGTADGYEIKYCSNPSDATILYGDNGFDYQCFLYIPADIATALAGNQLVDISYCIAKTGKSDLAGYVFVSEDLDAEPVVKQDIVFENGYENNAFKFKTAVLDKPYTIKENTGFYFGFYAANCTYKVDYPIAIDGQSGNSFAGYVNAYYMGELVDVVDMASDLGTNLAMYATTIGEKTTIENIFSLNTAKFAGSFDLPILKDENGSLPKITVSLTNYGDNKLSSMEYSYAIDDNEPVDGKATLNIRSMKTGNSSITIANPVMTPGRHIITLTIKSINDVAVSESINASYICLADGGFKRVVFVEEGTGTGCGWCPRGIVGMETMAREHSSDEYIGVAVHCDWFGTDPLTVESYQPFMYGTFSGLPSSIVNRDSHFIKDPSAATLESQYKKWADERTLAQMQITEAAYDESENKVDVTVSTLFNFDETDADYRLAFILKEDGLKAVQTNYYAPSYGQGATLAGWDDKGASVAWTYTETARDIFDVWGIEGSVPGNIVAGEKYTYTYPVSLRNLYIGSKLTQQGNIKDTSIVAILIDGETGTVLQATTISADQYSIAGINDVVADVNAPVEYFNLQGMRMNGTNMPAGIYIVKQGQNTQKQVIR